MSNNIIAIIYSWVYRGMMHFVGGHAPADKVRVKNPTQGPERGVIEAVKGKTLVVRLTDGTIINVAPRDITNFSLAARKAWKSKPNRRVGRPRGTSVSNRVSVTLRIDRDVWDNFKRAEAAGIISGRTELLNQWIRQKLNRLQAVGKRTS